MSIFKEVGLTWAGEEYVVPPEKVMGLIEVIEDSITLEELADMRRVRRGAISKAYAMALRYAGAKGVTQQDVYTMFFGTDKVVELQSIVSGLIMMMIPPEHLQDNSQPEKKQKPPAKKKSAKDL